MRRFGFVEFLGCAALLHGALLWWLAGHTAIARQASEPHDVTELSIIVDERGARTQHPVPASSTEAPVGRLAAPASRLGRVHPRGAALSDVGSRPARVELDAQPIQRSPEESTHAGSSEGLPETSTALGNEQVAADDAPEGVNSPEPNAPDSKSPEPRLSLSQMGIGSASPFVLTPLPRDPADVEVLRAEQRLQHQLAQGALEQDAQKGLTGGSWLTSVIDQAAMGRAPPRSKARLSILTDATGLVVRVEVLESNASNEDWRRVADKALTELSTKRRNLNLGRPVRTVIDVESGVALPSGRSPGMGVSLLNIPLKRREYKDSPNIELLSLRPKLETIEILDPTKSGGAMLELPVVMLQFQVLGINGDLVDVGAVGRQVVHSRVVSEEAL